VLGGQGGELGQLLVDEAEGGGEVLGVDVVGEEAADVACVGICVSFAWYRVLRINMGGL